MFFPAGTGKREGGNGSYTKPASREPPRLCSGVRATRSNHFQNASSRFHRPRPCRGFPATRFICMALPLPRCHWLAPRPAHCSSTTAGFRPPSRSELRAAGGLLNRGGGGGGGSRGGSGAHSADESAAPRVGGGGRAARDHLSSPHHGRTEGAAAEGSQGTPAGEWPASQRWAEVGGSPLLGTAAARGRESEDRRVDLRARRPTSSLLVPRILWAVGLWVPAQDSALGQGSDHSQI